MSIETVTMAVATCDRCGERSDVLPQPHVDEWQDRHQKKHDFEDRIERMRLLGHDCQVVDAWMDNDDSSGRVSCTCGYKSPESKLCWMTDYIDRHLTEVEQQLLDAWAAAA